MVNSLLRLYAVYINPRRTRRHHNALKASFRDAANRKRTSKNQLGEFFRHIQMKKGYQCAITATARKLAIVIYHMLEHKAPFNAQLATG